MPALTAPVDTDCGGRWVSPGLIDCHTHLVYAGSRANEFGRRLAGVSYEQIAREGGGIISTVRATREADVASLVKNALPRLDALIAEGTTTVEIKSGYGLNLKAERAQLQAARQLANKRPVGIMTTFLGAHAVPPEFAGKADDYITVVCDEILPAIARDGLADFVDGFCENIAFSVAQMTRVFDKAKALGLPMRLHADQLTNGGGAKLAAHYGATSADHLEYVDEAGVAAMAKAGTIAVVLPGAYYFIREPKAPPIDLFRKARVPMALATDSNPGTSPMTSLLLTMNMGATLFRMTVDECIAGITREAARALGAFNDIGSLEAGKSCDLAIWDIEEPAELVYRIGFNPLHSRVFKGRTTHTAPDLSI
jgi:imidazolonepropionase